MILPVQIRAARALVGWTQAALARASGVAEVSIKKIERGDTDPRVSTLRDIQEALEDAGVIFVPENGGGAGVRLHKERLTGWKQCLTRLSDARAIFESFDACFQLAGSPRDMALLSRHDRDQDLVYLVTPAAVRWLDRMPGTWTDAENPSVYGWAVDIANGSPHERFGLKWPRVGRD